MKLAKKVLIVEDESPLLNALRDMLSDEGFSILVAKDGRKGLEIALSEHPDLILLDIELPIMDGITLLKKLHTDIWGKHAKVVMLTESSDTQDLADAIGLGSEYFLIKSDWALEDVVRVVRSKLNNY